MEFYYWYWLVIGLGLIIVEAMTPGFYTLWIGIAGIITGCLNYFIPSMPFYVAGTIFAVLSFIICYLGKAFVYKKDRASVDPTLNNRASQYVGQKFKVVDAIENGKGKVKIGDTLWTVLSDKDVKEGAFVTIKGFKGTNLLV